MATLSRLEVVLQVLTGLASRKIGTPAKSVQTVAVENGDGVAKIELNNPNIILERRVHLEAAEAGARHRRQIDTSSGSPGQTATLSLGESNTLLKFM